MLAKYLISIFLSVLINNVIGFKALMAKDETFDNKFENKLEEIKKKLEEDLGKTLENKLKEIHAQKIEFEDILVKKLVGILEEKHENDEENLRKKLETNLENKIMKNLENKLEGCLKNKLEDKDKLVKNISSDIGWIRTSLIDAISLNSRAVVGGFLAEGKPLWIVRSSIEEDLIPGKLNINDHHAYFPFDTKEVVRKNASDIVEVFCAPPDKVQWVKCTDGVVPPNAVVGGHTRTKEKLYVGRIKEQGKWTPGKVHPSHKRLYISIDGRELHREKYEVLCLV